MEIREVSSNYLFNRSPKISWFIGESETTASKRTATKTKYAIQSLRLAMKYMLFNFYYLEKAFYLQRNEL